MNKIFCSHFILWISSPNQTIVRDLITGLVVFEFTFKNLSRNFLNFDSIFSNFFNFRLAFNKVRWVLSNLRGASSSLRFALSNLRLIIGWTLLFFSIFERPLFKKSMSDSAFLISHRAFSMLVPDLAIVISALWYSRLSSVSSSSYEKRL